MGNHKIYKRYSYWQFFVNMLAFWKNAGNAHAIHPPFLFHLYTEIIKSKRICNSLLTAIKFRKSLLCDNTLISYTPSGSSAGQLQTLTISKIANNQSISKKKGKLLFKLVSHFQPLTIIELGTNLGVGTMFLSCGQQNGIVYSIEGSKELFDVAHQKINLSQRENIELLQGEFNTVLPDILQKINTLDFVFFDGDHTKEATLKYFELCCTKANNNTVFVFDDIHWSPGMDEAWTEIVNDQRITLAVDLYSLGIVFFRKELSKQFFKLRF